MSYEWCRLQKLSHRFPLRPPDSPLHVCWWRAAPGQLHLLPVTNGRREPGAHQRTGAPDLTPSFPTITMAKCKGTVFSLQKEGIVLCNFELEHSLTGKNHRLFELPVPLPVISKHPLEFLCLIIYWICLNLPQKSLSSSQSEVVCLKQLHVVGCSVILTH